MRTIMGFCGTCSDITDFTKGLMQAAPRGHGESRIVDVGCGLLGYDMYRNGDNFRPGDGILGDDVEDTVRNVGVLAAQGMRETDRVILKIMTE